ncbi:hypothetical protein PR202_ga23805 [Eleusine coracana subsp. coracana]|uniref:Cell division control protein n=1 Tax=Eleusine coracana subsp. coracana TaxID=191504 RepID=A0AAV5D7A6_ELECO|nr:hypothetical protein PR202_ga23805 [Eleusine coracana subsp. coracana]
MPTLRSATATSSPADTLSPAASTTPRSVKRRLTLRRAGESPDAPTRHTSPHRSPLAGGGSVFAPKFLSASPKSSRKRLYGDPVAPEKPKWDPRGKPLKASTSIFGQAVSLFCFSVWGLMENWVWHADPAQMRAVKEALHFATVPSCGLVCREDEQNRVLEFCKACVEQEKAGSLYVCGCPGTGKTLSINKVKGSLLRWADEMGMQTSDELAINYISTISWAEEGKRQIVTTYQQLRSMFSNKESDPRRMMYELLVSTDSWAFHAALVLLSKLHSAVVRMVVVDEMDYLITRDRAVLHDLFMLTTLPFSRCILIGIANAIDLADWFLPKLESLNCKPLVVTFRAYSKDQISDIIKHRLKVLEYDVFEPLALEFCARKIAAVSGDMRKALGVCRSAVEVFEARLKDSDQELGMMVLCALANTFQYCKKKATNLGEGFMKLGQSKEDKLRRVTLQIDSSEITFAFKGVDQKPFTSANDLSMNCCTGGMDAAVDFTLVRRMVMLWQGHRQPAEAFT